MTLIRKTTSIDRCWCPDSAQLLQRLIGIVLIVTIVFQWDGLWCLLDYYLGHTQISCFYCWALGTVVLCLTGCRNNMVTGVPFMCRHDRAELLFAATTRFHAKITFAVIRQPSLVVLRSALLHFCGSTICDFDLAWPLEHPGLHVTSKRSCQICQYFLPRRHSGDYCFVPSPRFCSRNYACIETLCAIRCRAGVAAVSCGLVGNSMERAMGVVRVNLRRIGLDVVCDASRCENGVKCQRLLFGVTKQSANSIGWILTILNMGGLSTQLGAVPDPPLDIRTDVIRFPIDYVAQIYKTHVQYTALIKQQQQPGQRLSTSPLSKPLLKTNRATAKALYPLLDEIQLPLPDSLPS
ncbi:uncharacterized protein LOC111260991 isoform X4 [Varroa jacobsoni]|uniref:uncharacterized protein LOC111260991 isoform X4 n=1 Tax=Varroa jacobsoni TaxID=62625 RepID=UPI000BF9D464|nr:uncharacterized protein LOC111260991 isoform X4 [Varroa jacobsoni]